jgi:hypothetical protein
MENVVVQEKAVRISTMCNGSAKWAGKSGRYRVCTYKLNPKTGKYRFDCTLLVFYGSKVQWSQAKALYNKMVSEGYKAL